MLFVQMFILSWLLESENVININLINVHHSRVKRHGPDAGTIDGRSLFVLKNNRGNITLPSNFNSSMGYVEYIWHVEVKSQDCGQPPWQLSEGTPHVRLKDEVFQLPEQNKYNRCATAYVQYGTYTLDNLQVLHSPQLCGQSKFDPFETSSDLWVAFVYYGREDEIAKKEDMAIHLHYEIFCLEAASEEDSALPVVLGCVITVLVVITPGSVYCIKKKRDARRVRERQRRRRLTRKNVVRKPYGSVKKKGKEDIPERVSCLENFDTLQKSKDNTYDEIPEFRFQAKVAFKGDDSTYMCPRDINDNVIPPQNSVLAHTLGKNVGVDSTLNIPKSPSVATYISFHGMLASCNGHSTLFSNQLPPSRHRSSQSTELHSEAHFQQSCISPLYRSPSSEEPQETKFRSSITFLSKLTPVWGDLKKKILGNPTSTPLDDLDVKKASCYMQGFTRKHHSAPEPHDNAVTNRSPKPHVQFDKIQNQLLPQSIYAKYCIKMKKDHQGLDNISQEEGMRVPLTKILISPAKDDLAPGVDAADQREDNSAPEMKKSNLATATPTIKVEDYSDVVMETPWVTAPDSASPKSPSAWSMDSVFI
ncbi:uncharacterized protein LOC106181892 isoform X2 [Lingula anatina]|uniref:Uncharacterized protein LOC106181892 isoform X2 n=1 Tax=Lingula anatina TaxID=7574 RepID=A0A1S3KI32_LINAN|nr:uncharacterized protein LOC106181892 isoform X2 [Lingula anatina]|eukprot:XP_013421881.1 uncharacterized protein LOC106181892 isoform X2 [Lingula anatina]